MTGMGVGRQRQYIRISCMYEGFVTMKDSKINKLKKRKSVTERKQRLSLRRGLCGSQAGTESRAEPGQTEPHCTHYANRDGKPHKALSRDTMFGMGKGMSTTVEPKGKGVFDAS